MPSSPLRAVLRRGLLAFAVLVACTEESGLPDPPQIDLTGFEVEPVDMHTIRLRWPNAGVNGYRIERRANLEGDFLPTANLPPATTTFLDRELTPGTQYGYRLVALNALGQVLGTSTVGSATTAPEPGIEITTRSSGGPESEDMNGYEATISRGLNQITLAMPWNGSQLVAPLESGTYSVVLSGLAPQCEPLNGLSKSVPVTNAGLNTVAKVLFEITCRDPTRARLTVPVTVEGDTTDSDGVRLVLSGIADDTSLPPDQRSVLIVRQFGPNGGVSTYDNLRPGTYGLVVEDLATYCTLDPVQRDNIKLEALDDEELGFNLNCRGNSGNSGPLRLKATFTPDSAESGQKTRLDLSLDLTGVPGTSVGAFGMEVRVNQAVARIDSIVVAEPFAGSSNPNPTTGRAALSYFTTSPRTGVVSLAKLYYTAVGTQGTATAVEIRSLSVASGDGSTLQDQVGVERNTFTVAKKLGSGTPNVPPVAEAGGPYQAMAGQPVQLSATGSIDPDGQIVSYAWTFGDNATGSGATASHTYATAGTYTASLVVTDNRGATATDQATVTVTPGTQPSTKPLTWKSTFSAVNEASWVDLNLSLDLRSDLSETPGAETLVSWTLDSLGFDPARLQFIVWTPGSGSSSLNNSGLGRGIIRIQGTPASNRATGMVSIGTVTFLVKPPSGSGTTTATTTWLGAIQGKGASSSQVVNYTGRTSIEEGTLTVPDGPPPTGTTVSGNVTSPQRGALAGVTVSISGAGSATTSSSGSWSVSNVAAGSRTVSLGNIPSGCTSPASQTITVASTPMTNINFTVTCQQAPATGTVNGSITFASGSATPSLVGANISVTPSGDGSQVQVHPNASGTYSATVQIGNGSGNILASNLPSGCTPAAPTATYSGLTAGGTVTATGIQINCTAAPPAGYQFKTRFDPPSSGTVTMYAVIDMSTRNDPGNNGSGPDKIGAWSMALRYPSRLSNPSCTGQSGFGGGINTNIPNRPGEIAFSLFNSSGATGAAVILAKCTFTVAAGGSVAMSNGGTPPTVTFSSESGLNFTQFVQITHDPLP